MKEIRIGQTTAYVPRPVLVETFHHMCKTDGIENARNTIVNFLKNYPLKLVDLDQQLILDAGQLKCQHASALSYIDCMGIAVALSHKIPFHTTEKNLKKIPHNVLSRLKVETNSF